MSRDAYTSCSRDFYASLVASIGSLTSEKIIKSNPISLSSDFSNDGLGKILRRKRTRVWNGEEYYIDTTPVTVMSEEMAVRLGKTYC